MTDRTLTGSCLCGAVSFRYEGPVGMEYLCHCTDCQKVSGTAWHAGLLIEADRFEVSGEVTEYATTAESGNQLVRMFCPTCGSQLWSTTSRGPKFLSLNAGALDDTSAFEPSVEIWARSKVGWATPTGLESHTKGYGSKTETAS